LHTCRTFNPHAKFQDFCRGLRLFGNSKKQPDQKILCAIMHHSKALMNKKTQPHSFCASPDSNAKTKTKSPVHFGGLLLLALTALLVFGRTCYGGEWYVGNTAAGEWVQYTNVWLSDGSYRFTANAGSPAAGATMHLEVDGVTIRSGVAVPNTGRVDTFAYAHLGSTTLAQGYHTLKVVFETPGISLDWVMLRKDTDTTTTVKASDTVMVRPPTTGMLVAPVVAFADQSDANAVVGGKSDDVAWVLSIPYTDARGGNYTYSDYQLASWYRAPMSYDYDRTSDRFWDIRVDELLASRAQVPLFHCRATADFTHDLQDRAYVRGGGSYEGRWLVKLVEAVKRSPQAASSLQIGMFLENGGLGDGYFSTYAHYPSGWADSTLADYTMQYWLQPWFDSVPSSLLYQPFPGRPIISIYSGTPNGIPQDGQMGTFLNNIRNRMQTRYGLDPVFICPLDADASAQAIAWGRAPWLTWAGPMLNMNYFGGTYWCTTSAGSRRRLDTVWLNDWNPVTNTGTPGGDSPGVDSYQSPLDANGKSVLLGNLSHALAAGARFIQEEGFENISEGNAMFRSCAPGWKFPNQNLAAMRQYADLNNESLIFEAEACDSYYKTTAHENLGGSYRRQWYSSTGLDVYRPLHNLNAWANKSVGPGNLVDLSAGFFDVWALDANGQVWSHVISDGAPDTWTSVSMDGVAKFTSLSVGNHFAWAINGNTVYTCRLPYSWPNNAHTSWTQTTGNMVQLSVNEAEVWAVDAAGLIYRRPVNEANVPGGVWTQVTGPAMSKVFVGGNGRFVWGMSGSSIYYSPTTNVNWTLVANPNSITQLSVGSEEVWGINAAGNVFRGSISGVGGWDAVDGNLSKIAIGENYAWGLSGSTPSSRRLTGFLGTAVASIPSAPTGVTATAGNTQAKLTWTPVSGASGYYVKRGTANGGPYTNVVVSTTSTGVDTGLANGTTYYYVVSAISGIGESANSTQVSVVPTATGTPPIAPTTLTATAGQTSISLSWNASSGATSYNVKRATVYGGSFTTIATGVTSTSYTDTGLTPDNTYTYVVSAVNAAGESFTDSASASAAPTGILLSRTGWVASASVNSANAGNAIDGNASTRWDTAGSQTPGQWFQIDMGSAQSFYKLVLDDTASPNDYPRGYQVNVSSDGVNWGSPVATGNGSTTITTITFASQTARYFRITQTGTSGNYWSIHESYAYAMPAGSPPPAPTGLTATAVSSSQINLSWTASSGATSYNIKRATVSGGPYTTIATGVTATGFSDVGLSASTTYYYVVSAVNSGGESANSTQASATTQAGVPAAPTGLTATAGNNQVALSWTASSGATSYNVKRATVSGGPYTTVASPTTASYTDTTAVNGTTYYYVVSAVNTSGESANSTQVSATPTAGAVLLSQSQPVTASSSSGANPAANGNDGSLTTRWSASSTTYPQWWRVDLGASHTLSQVVINWYQSSSRNYQYKIEVSGDDVTYTTVVDQTGRTGFGDTTDNFSATGRYVRVTVTGSTTGSRASFYECKVYGN
jgi:fibronectin type 3 domain-containing protein